MIKGCQAFCAVEAKIPFLFVSSDTLPLDPFPGDFTHTPPLSGGSGFGLALTETLDGFCLDQTSPDSSSPILSSVKISSSSSLASVLGCEPLFYLFQ